MASEVGHFWAHREAQEGVAKEEGEKVFGEQAGRYKTDRGIQGSAELPHDTAKMSDKGRH